ncbi:MAG: DUF454 domain-containing protein [Clostridia bacterium]|jgi:uncharacterized membrane protein YbaN (DUF454 family)|nr:DUF454 domain-containing protein [Clostridia bacterium]
MKNIKKFLLIVIGIVAMGLGMLGIILPVLPTTPFLLLSAACFIRSSEKLYNFLITNKYFGHYIKDYREGKGIPKKTKVIALVMLWATILPCIVFFIDKLIIQLVIFAIASTVTVYIIKIKNKEVKAIINEEIG